MEEKKAYSLARGIVKSTGHGVLGFFCYVLAEHLPFIPAVGINPAAVGLFVAAEFVRNALKVRLPRFFSWL